MKLVCVPDFTIGLLKYSKIFDIRTKYVHFYLRKNEYFSYIKESRSYRYLNLRILDTDTDLDLFSVFRFKSPQVRFKLEMD